MKKLALLALLVGGLSLGIGAGTASAHGPVMGPSHYHHGNHIHVNPGYRMYRPYPYYRPYYAPIYTYPSCGGVILSTPNFGVGFGW